MDGDVECGYGFVADYEVGLDGEGACDADALALSAAEFVGEASRHFGVESDHFEQFGDSAVVFGAGGCEVVDRDAFADDGAGGHSGVERAVGVLEDDLHSAAEVAEFAAAHGR